MTHSIPQVCMTSADTSLKIVKRRNPPDGLRVTQRAAGPARSETEESLPNEVERYRVQEYSEKWRQRAEELLQACPTEDDLTYIQHFLVRLEFQKFNTDSTARSTIKASKARRAEQAGRRRMRR